MENQLLQRITINPEVLHGKPSIRNMRFAVSDLLSLLASGMTSDEILADYPYLEAEDIKACLVYASKVADTNSILPLAS
jgi:uncharacterized protein (DUF433 family)